MAPVPGLGLGAPAGRERGVVPLHLLDGLVRQGQLLEVGRLAAHLPDLAADGLEELLAGQPGHDLLDL
eukprot:8884166-Alexandrium_andersonii.AAC.1